MLVCFWINKVYLIKERERELTLVFQQKEKHVKGLTKKYESLKNQLWEQAKKGRVLDYKTLIKRILERATATGVKIDSNLFREITMLKDKIQDKAHRIELLERELDSHKNQAE